MAAEVGTTRRHMIRLENGEHLPSRALRDRIAEATDQPAESIQSADDEEDALPRRTLSEDLHRLAQIASLLETQPQMLEGMLAAESEA